MMNILEDKENTFFKRRELKVEIPHEGKQTPSKQEVIKEVSEKYSVPPELVSIDYILTKKGTNVALAKIKIYKEKKEEKSETQAGKPS
jgi:ribosomal protein S24E